MYPYKIQHTSAECRVSCSRNRGPSRLAGFHRLASLRCGACPRSAPKRRDSVTAADHQQLGELNKKITSWYQDRIKNVAQKKVPAVNCRHRCAVCVAFGRVSRAAVIRQEGKNFQAGARTSTSSESSRKRKGTDSVLSPHLQARSPRSNPIYPSACSSIPAPAHTSVSQPPRPTGTKLVLSTLSCWPNATPQFCAGRTMTARMRMQPIAALFKVVHRDGVLAHSRMDTCMRAHAACLQHRQWSTHHHAFSACRSSPFRHNSCSQLRPHHRRNQPPRHRQQQQHRFV
jgi:hypothetical protein